MTAGRKRQACVRNCARGLQRKWMAERKINSANGLIVEKGVYEVGHYGQNYNKVVLEFNKMHYHEIYVTNYC